MGRGNILTTDGFTGGVVTRDKGGVFLGGGMEWDGMDWVGLRDISGFHYYHCVQLKKDTPLITPLR